MASHPQELDWRDYHSQDEYAKMILRHYGLCPEDGIDLLN